MQVISRNYTFEWRPEYPFLVNATRYYLPTGTVASSHEQSSPGFTAIFAHGTGFHKEQWEPTIHRLFEFNTKANLPILREAWSVDCPNHGQSYILNEKSIAEYAYTLICT